ncbi:MAG: phytanoyl-CoA dioxygenase family protein [bacterium]
MNLSPDHIAFFKDNGYLLLEGLLDPALCAQVRDRMWNSLPEDSRLRRDDPSTHIGPFREEDIQNDSIHLRQGYRWQNREFGTDPLLLDLIYNERICAIAEQLLGKGMLEPPKVGGKLMGSEGAAWPNGPIDPAISEGVRGVYNTLPYGDKPRENDYCHTDGHPFNLGVVGLIDDVPSDGGGFKIWPKSHRRLYPTFQMQYDQPRIPYYAHLPSHKGIIQSPAYDKEIKAILRDTPAVDCWGKEGDIVFWHHRQAHMAGHNYTHVIRQAVLYDFKRTDLDTCRMDPPQDDMWRDWSNELRASDASYSEAFAASQRLTV